MWGCLVLIELLCFHEPHVIEFAPGHPVSTTVIKADTYEAEITKSTDFIAHPNWR